MKKNSFIEGTLIATIALILVKILGILYVIPFFKIVGEEGANLYTYAYNIYIVFLTISTAGIPIAMSKIINEYNTLNMQEAKTRAYKIGIKIISIISVIIFLVLFIFAKDIMILIKGNYSGSSSINDVVFVIRCVSFAVLVIPFLSVTRGYLEGHKVITPASLSEFIEQLIRILVIVIGCFLVVKVFNGSIRNAVGLAVFGAFVGGLVAILYLLKILKKNRQELGFVKHEKKDDISNKAILKKIVMYAIPFIAISGVANLYNIVNMSLIFRTLTRLGYDSFFADSVVTAIVTKSSKLNVIVTSIAIGMIVSLIPTIVSSFVKKDWQDVNNKLNNAMQIVLVISIPMVIGLTMLSKSVWTVFYGYSAVGISIFALNIFVALFNNLYTVTTSTLQGLNKFKQVYLCTLVGFVCNAVLDVPLMLLFNKIGIPAYQGAAVASMIGYSVSVIMALYYLNKEHNFNYKDTLKVFIRILFPTVLMIIVLIILKLIIPYKTDNRISCLIFIIINAVIGGAVYLFTAYKMGLFHHIFGAKFLKQIKEKLTFKR